MASYSSYNKTKRLTTGNEIQLVPVRSTVFYGIETKKINEQKSTIQRELFVVPNIKFYGSFTKAIIDFSDYKNNKEKSNIKSFFDLIKYGYTFTILNAKWNNRSIDEITYDISGTFTFTKIVDDIIFCDVVSINSYSTEIERYDKEYFLELPLIEFTESVEKQKKEIKSYIFNHLGKNSKNSFAYLGAKPGDYIELQNRKEKYKIESINIDNEGKETLVVYGDVGNSSNIGTPNLVVLHQQNLNKIQITEDNEKLGKCEIVVNNSIVECIDNHTLLQSKLREDKLNGITTNFIEGEFCLGITDPQTIENIKNASNSMAQQMQFASFSRQRANLSNIDSSRLSRSNLINAIFND